MTKYPLEILDEDYDNGTMSENVDDLAGQVVGRRIVKVEESVDLPASRRGWWHDNAGLVLTLDNGKRVFLVDTYDCCAYTELKDVIRHLDTVDHIITGVGTTEGYTKWHIYADFGDVLELTVDWCSGNPFYYGYGFEILVFDAKDEK